MMNPQSERPRVNKNKLPPTRVEESARLEKSEDQALPVRARGVGASEDPLLLQPHGPPHKKGYLITLEGIEGSGKSSQIAILAEYLEQNNWNVLKTREPGGTKLGERIRDLLLDTRHPDITAKTELLLYLASRAQHFQEVILPALQQRKVVLCDRFSEATLAYQGYGRGLDLNKVKTLLSYVTEGRKPDLTLLLDLEVRQGLMRINSRTSKDRLEQERIEFYEKVRQGYLKLAKMSPRQIVVIDAGHSFEKVATQIREIVEAFLKKNVIQKHRRP